MQSEHTKKALLEPSEVEVAPPVAENENGLSAAEARERLAQYGYNELPEAKRNLFLKILSYFWGPIRRVVEAAAVLSLLVRHWADFGIILLLRSVNGGVGFWEEYQASDAIAALKAKLALQARVKREGTWSVIPARELVPRDRIRLRFGDIIPADARLLEGDPIEVDQSALTGESLPVTRPAASAVYSSSIVRRGEIDAVVYATGKSTYFGKTTRLVETAHSVSHFQRAVLKIGDHLIVLALGVVTLILTVAAVPVALPAVLSVTMAVGARLLARKQAIVSHLESVEELAGVDVLCADKTGTLAQNKPALSEPFCIRGTPRL
jgi:H+-transporting ATPase